MIKETDEMFKKETSSKGIIKAKIKQSKILSAIFLIIKYYLIILAGGFAIAALGKIAFGGILIFTIYKLVFNLQRKNKKALIGGIIMSIILIPLAYDLANDMDTDNELVYNTNNLEEDANVLEYTEPVTEKVEVIEYILGGNNMDYSKKVSVSSDVYGIQEDIVYEVPEGTYKIEMLTNKSVGKAGLVEIESCDLTREVEYGESYEYFKVRETISFNTLINEVESHEIIINSNEQIDINGNIVIKLTKIG